MRFEETCKCGASLVLGYEVGRRARYPDSEMEGYEARKHIENFRRRHKDCLKPSGPTHSDETQGERDGA